MEQLLTVASVMVAGGKADVKLLNEYLKDYSNLLFGSKAEFLKSSSTKNEKEEILDKMKGFRALFKEKVVFKPKVGKKLDGEFTNVNLAELMKSEKK